MHVLIIPSWYPQNDKDIGGIFFRDQALAIKNLGNEVGVICPILRSLRKPSNIFFGGYGISYEQDCGVNTYRYKGVRWFIGMNNDFNKNDCIKKGLALFEVYKKNHGIPDIIHVQSMLFAGAIAERIKEHYNIPYIVTEHTSLYHKNLLSDKNLLLAAEIANKSSYCSTVSKEFSEFLSKKLSSEKDWGVIPNIVEENFFEADIKELSEKEFIFCSIGRLVSGKQHTNLINAFNKSFKDNKNVKLYIGGGGELFNVLRDLISDLCLDDQIFLLGNLGREDVIKLIQNSHSLVVSSDYETFGVVLIEALALGKPIVTTKCGGPNEIINEKNGLKVDVGDVSQLSNALRDMQVQYKNYSSREIRESCRQKYSGAVVAKKINSLYEKVLCNEFK